MCYSIFQCGRSQTTPLSQSTAFLEMALEVRETYRVTPAYYTLENKTYRLCNVMFMLDGINNLSSFNLQKP
jgi:hypothetical protein